MRKLLFVFLWLLLLTVSGCGEDPKEIFKACEKGDLNKVKAIVNSNPDSLKLLSELGKTPPIYSAAVCGKAEIAEFLISKGAEINKLSGDGVLACTPIFLAVQKNDQKMVEVFINHGADVKIKNGLGVSVLHSAIMNKKDLSIIELLISKGADVNAKEGFKDKTPLELAQEAKNEKLIEVLKKNGAR